MNKIIQIKNYKLELNGKQMLNDFSVCLNSGEAICVLGESGSGKSLLLKSLIANRDKWAATGKISFYLGETVNVKDWKEEFQYKSLDKNWQDFLNIFMANATNLSIRYAVMLKVLEKPDFLLCEDLHLYLTREEMKMFVTFLKRENIGFLYLTNYVEDTIYFDYLIILKNNQVAMEGKTLQVLKEEKLMKLLGFSLPFYVNMSIQLGYYGLLDKICLSKEELEENLWPSK